MNLPAGYFMEEDPDCRPLFFRYSEHSIELVRPFTEETSDEEIERYAWGKVVDRAASEHGLVEVLMDRLHLGESERTEYRERLGTLKLISLCESLDIMLDGEGDSEEDADGWPSFGGTSTDEDGAARTGWRQ